MKSIFRKKDLSKFFISIFFMILTIGGSLVVATKDTIENNLETNFWQESNYGVVGDVGDGYYSVLYEETIEGDNGYDITSVKKIRTNDNTNSFEMKYSHAESSMVITMDKDKLDLKQFDEIEIGDLVYFSTIKNNNKLELLSVVFAENNEASISSNEEFFDEIIGNLIVHRMGRFKSNQVIEYDGEIMFFDSGIRGISESNLNYPREDFFDFDENSKIRYLFDGSSVDLIYVERANKKGVDNSTSIKVIFDSSIKVENGYELLFTKATDNKKNLEKLTTSKYFSSNITKLLENNLIKKGDEILVYENVLGYLTEIKNPFNKDIKKFTGLTKDIISPSNYNLTLINDLGEEKTFFVDENIVGSLNGMDLNEGIFEVEYEDSYCALSVKKIFDISEDSKSYRLLNIGNHRVELGYGMSEIAQDFEFDLDQRVWIDLANDFTWIGKEKFIRSSGTSVSIALDDENKIKYMSSNKGENNENRFYSINSPLDNLKTDETPLVLCEIKFNKRGEIQVDGVKSDVRFENITNNTKYFIYEYDIDKIKKDTKSWKLLLKGQLENIKGLQEISAEKFKDSEGSIVLASSSKGYKEYDGELIKIIKIHPTKNSILKGSLNLNLFESNSKEIFKVRPLDGLFFEGEFIDIYEVLDNYEKVFEGIPILDSKGNLDVLMSKGKLRENYEEKKYDDMRTFTGIIESVDDDYIKASIGNDSYRLDIDENVDIEKIKTYNVPIICSLKVSGEWRTNGRDFIIKEIEYIEPVIEAKLYRYLGTLNDNWVFGFGGNIEADEYEIDHMFIVNKSYFVDSEFLNTIDEYEIGKYDIDRLSYKMKNYRQREAIYFIGDIDQTGTLKFLQYNEEVNRAVKRDKSEIFKKENFNMGQKSLGFKPVSNDYMEAEVEILKSVLLENNNESVVTLKTVDGFEYEVKSISDYWVTYEPGSKLKVMMKLEKGIPVQICWAEEIENIKH